jgi:hypothetical protein
MRTCYDYYQSFIEALRLVVRKRGKRLAGSKFQHYKLYN